MRKEDKLQIIEIIKNGGFWVKDCKGNAKQGKAHRMNDFYSLRNPDGSRVRLDGKPINIGKKLQLSLGGMVLTKEELKNEL